MNIYSNTARFDTGRALTEDEMRRLAPSIFATSAHESRSERFAPIPTIDILRGLQNEGFMPVGAKQSRSRDESRREYTKHLIRLRRMDAPQKYQVGDTVCEILLKNANDGTCCYDILAGLFRIRCLNSMVAQTGTVDQVKVRHSGDVQGKVIEGTYRVLEQATAALEAPRVWSQIDLDQGERDAFAKAARVLRIEDQSPITHNQFLHPRRQDDAGRDLWRTFNVVQENMIRGGLSGRGYGPNGDIRTTTTREVKGIDQSVKLNQALWTLAHEMAKLKAPAIAA
jgi:hypothetical protein